MILVMPYAIHKWVLEMFHHMFNLHQNKVEIDQFSSGLLPHCASSLLRLYCIDSIDMEESVCPSVDRTDNHQSSLRYSFLFTQSPHHSLQFAPSPHHENRNHSRNGLYTRRYLKLVFLVCQRNDTTTLCR